MFDSISSTYLPSKGETIVIYELDDNTAYIITFKDGGYTTEVRHYTGGYNNA